MPSYKDSQRGTWYCKFSYIDWTGARKQKLKRGFQLKREADAFERDFLQKLAGSPDMTFQQLSDLYFEDMKQRLRPASYDLKESLNRCHILPYFRDIALKDITPGMVRKWEAGIISSDLSEYTQLHIYSTLSIMLNYAVKFYGLHDNPCRKAGKIGRATKSLQFWTISQFQEAMKHVTDPAVKTIFYLLFFGGFRIGELLALTPADINLDLHMISITKTHHSDGSTGKPKTERSYRSVIMPEKVMQLLADYMKRLYKPRKTDRIFPYSNLKLRKELRKAAAAAGLPVIRLHDLRHSHVSLLIEQGSTPLLIADRIGDTVDMVNRVYGHLYPNKQQEVADRLNELIKI